MNTDVLGITALNGADHFSQKERFSVISKVGFKSVMLAWGTDDCRQESIALAEEYGLKIENAHSDMHNCNPIWLDIKEGEEKTSQLLKTVEDCGKYGIKTMIMHLSNGFDTPPLSDIGLKRIEKIFDLAKDTDVTVALENARVCTHLKYVLDNYTDEHIKYCFDCGHANIWCKDTPWLDLYGQRVVAVHLHDNGGKEDDHMIPFTGTVKWGDVLKGIDMSSYRGSLTLETEVKGISDIDDFTEYLRRAYAAATKLAQNYGYLRTRV
jgi:sugar phosphate isomerase/epimerase